MECVIPGRSVKIFAKIIHCLSKVGDELFLEPAADKLVFRTLNQARSAFVAINFSPNFFESYTLTSEIFPKCKVLLKPCLAVFRSITTVQKCTIRLDEAESRVVIELLCNLGIKKTYRLTFEECEALQAVYSKDNCPNKITSRPRLLIDVVQNFHSGLDEISFQITEKMFKVKSFIDEDKRSQPSKILHTELTIDPRDFEEYSVGTEPGEITFCLKEFKALLGFCEVAGQPIHIWFEQGGRPILFSVNFFNAFDVDFVMATLLDGQGSSSQSDSSQSSSQSSSSSQQSKQSYSGTPSATPASSASVPASPYSSRAPTSPFATPTTVSSYPDRDGVSGMTSVTSSMVEEIGTDKRRRGEMDKEDSLSASASPTASASHPPPFLAAGMVTQPRMDIEGEGDDEDEDDEEDEFVEGTPPSSPQLTKRARRG